MVDAAWHEEMRGRCRGLLLAVADRVPELTAGLAGELIDANECGIAIEMIADVLDETGASLGDDESDWLHSLHFDMGLGER